MESIFDEGYQCALQKITQYVEKYPLIHISREDLLQKLKSLWIEKYMNSNFSKEEKISHTVDINSTEKQHIYITSPHTVIINKDDKGIEIKVHHNDGHGDGGIGQMK